MYYAAAPIANRAGEPFLTAEFRLLFMITFAICVVIPHSVQAVTAGLILITALTSVFVIRGSGKLTYIGVCYILGALVTCLYMGIGLARGAPAEAIFQTTATYIISPLAWIVILRAALQLTSIERMTRTFVVLAWLSCVSVAIFFYLYLSFGADAVSFLSEAANVYVGQGYSGATMHVYASLIFLVAAFFAAPELIRNRLNRILLLSALAIAAFTSGRAALLIALPVGLTAGVIIRQFARRGSDRSARAGVWFRYLISLIGILAVLLILDYFIADLDFVTILQGAWQKLAGGGGEARVDQTWALWQGLGDTWGLGAGHGIGASIERSAEFGWRYENVPLAVLFRTGVFGAAIYALPFVIFVFRATRRMLAGAISNYDRFMLGGFTGILIASPTNPYLESFIFQWMFILPLIALDMTATGAHAHRQTAASAPQEPPTQPAYSAG